VSAASSVKWLLARPYSQVSKFAFNIFLLGTSTLNQIERIIELLGRPKNDDLVAFQSQLAVTVLQSIATQKKKSISQVFEGGCEDSVDFIRYPGENLLQY
jgi:hypothetical protein